MTDLSRLRAQIEAFVPYNEQEEADRRQILADMDAFPNLLTRENATAHFTASYNINVYHVGGMQREGFFNADAIGQAANRKGFGDSAIFLADDCTFKHLNSFAVSFFNPVMDTNGIPNVKLRNFFF